jgi:hypothetical protein
LGPIANVVLLVAVVYGAFAWGPFGLRAEYERLVRDGTSRMASSARPPSITEADLSALAPLVPVVRVEGRQMMRGETVTLLNAACLFAPGSLLDLPIRWRELDARSVEAAYTSGPHTIRAVLVFDDSGSLVDFRSDDRPALAEDGKILLSQRWSTPIREYRPMGPCRLAASGQARSAAPTGEYAYIELGVNELSAEVVPYDGGRR